MDRYVATAAAAPPITADDDVVDCDIMSMNMILHPLPHSLLDSEINC